MGMLDTSSFLIIDISFQSVFSLLGDATGEIDGHGLAQ